METILRQLLSLEINESAQLDILTGIALATTNKELFNATEIIRDETANRGNEENCSQNGELLQAIEYGAPAKEVEERVSDCKEATRD